MQYLKYTYVDAVTGVSVASEPAMNGTSFPAVNGLQYIWARESQYPTPVPQFYGTCPDNAATQVDGVLAVLSQTDWEAQQADEMRARIPQTVTMRQARLALLAAGKLNAVAPAIAAMPSPAKEQAQIEWEYSITVERQRPFVLALGPALGLDSAALDALFIAAAKL